MSSKKSHSDSQRQHGGMDDQGSRQQTQEIGHGNDRWKDRKSSDRSHSTGSHRGQQR